MQCSFFRRNSIVVVLFIVAWFIYGQESFPFPDLELFDSCLDRAECSETREEWTAIALEGERMVMARWEQEIRILVETGQNPEVLQDGIETLREQRRDMLSDTKHERLADWIMNKFVRDNSTFARNGYVGMIRDERNRAMYVSEDGRIVRDEKGNATILALDSPEAYEDELAAWSANAKELQSALINRLQNAAATSFCELLASEDEKVRQLIEARQDIVIADLEKSWRRQGDILFLLEQSEYRQFRLRDQSSLRLASERQSAEARTDEILEKTKSSISAGLDALKKGLDEEPGTVVQNARLVDGDEWQELFRLELNRGLELWNEAEEDLLIRRVEWEQKAGEDLVAGMDAWEQALQTILAEQRVWLVEMDTLRKTGEELFYADFEALRIAQQEALAELDDGIEENRVNLAEAVENSVGNLNRCLEMMNTSRNSIEYWLSSVPEGTSFDLNKVSWDETGILNALLEKMTSDVLESVCGIASLTTRYTLNVQKELSARIKKSVLKKIDAMYEDYRENEMLQEYLNTVRSGNPEQSLEYWRTQISEFLKQNLTGSIDFWFEDFFSGAVIDDVFSDRNICKIFGFKKPEEPDKADYDNLSSQAAATAYAAAVYNYENELLPDYQEKIERFGSISLEVLFSDDPEVKEDFGDLSEFRQNLKENIQEKYDTVIGKSLERNAYVEAWFWFADVYVPYSRMAEEQHADLAKTYGIIVYDTPTVPDEGFADDNEKIRGPIDALNEYGWETVCLDGYQLELVKARSVEAYWEREVEVAQAVWEYAADETNSRESEAITIENNRITLENYTRALEDYQGAVASLAAISDALEERNADIAACREEIQKKQEELTLARNEFTQLMVMAKLNTADFYVGRFRICYEDLLRERGLLPGGDSSWSPEDLGAVAANAISDVELMRTSSALESLVQGNPLGTQSDLPLGTLRALVEKLRGYVPEDDLADAIAGDPGKYLEEKLGLWREHPWYAVLCTAREQWILDNDMEALKEIFSEAGRQLLAGAEGMLAQRELMIRTLTGCCSGPA